MQEPVCSARGVRIQNLISFDWYGFWRGSTDTLHTCVLLGNPATLRSQQLHSLLVRCELD